jgi:hypothetical protein
VLSTLSGNDSIFYQNQWLTLFQKWGRGLEHAIQGCASCVFWCLQTFMAEDLSFLGSVPSVLQSLEGLKNTSTGNPMSQGLKKGRMGGEQDKERREGKMGAWLDLG